MTMSRKTGMRGKAIAVICCLALLVGCTGCGALKEGSRRERQSQQGQSSQQGERIASSLKDYARSLLDSDGGKISDQQKSALEKARESLKSDSSSTERAKPSEQSEEQRTAEREERRTQLIAAVAKELNLDAIHDTVHEMAKDEARHGRGFEGLLKRYFNTEV